jgi:two-component system response regulator
VLAAFVVAMSARISGSKNAPLGAILVVEDDANDALFLQRELGQKNLLNPVFVLKTADELFAYLEARGAYSDRMKFPYPVVVILDLHLPGTTGFEALAWMKLRPQHRDVPIIAISGCDDIDTLQEAVSCGANHSMVKPFQIGTFRKIASNLRLPIELDEN